MFDMNDAEPQKTGELIPDGTFAKINMIIRPGGIDGQSEIDQALLKAPKDPTSDTRMLDCEFTVVEGPHAKRKFWQMFTVQGGKVDENGVSIAWKISKSTFLAMIDSALGLDPQDMSEAAKQKRILRGLAESRLLGQRCPSCAKVYLPPRGACPTCGVPTTDEVELPGEGTVTTFCATLPSLPTT